MKVAFFDSHGFEKNVFPDTNKDFMHEITFFDTKLNPQTAHLTAGFQAVCVFVNDKVDSKTIQILANNKVKLIALRSAGFNNVDIKVAQSFGIKVVRVPEYSPYAVAEHAVALIQTLNRKIHRAHNRVKEGNFSLDGLVGFDLHGKTVGVLGTGRIGTAFSKIMLGFGCQVLAYDEFPNAELKSLGVQYQTLAEILLSSDIISLNVPLTPKTKHLINDESLKMTKQGVMIINTGRGALIDTKALIKHLKSGHIGAAGLDVYEEEEGVFFADHSDEILQDDRLARLLTFPNVLLTSHQAFLTKEALQNISQTTLQNIADFELGKPLKNEVKSN